MGVFASLGYWTHFWSLVVTVPFFILLIIDELRREKPKEERIADKVGVLVAPIIAVVSTLPLTMVMYTLFVNRISTPSQWGRKDIDLLVQYFSWIGYNNIVTIALMIALLLIGVVILYKLKRHIATDFIVVMLFVIIASVAISHTIPMLPRYMITLLPIIYTLIALTIMSMYANFRKVAYLVLILIVIISGISLHAYYTTYTREYWRGYSDELSKNTSPGDVIIVLPDYMRLALDFYYDNSTDGTMEYGVYNKVGDVITLSDPSKRIIYIFTWDISATDPNLETVKWIEANAKNIGTYYGISTFVREPTS
jgi:hypothetical protein